VDDGQYPYLRVDRPTLDHLVVSFGVRGGCDLRGTSVPSFAGFESKGDNLVARVMRTPPSSSPCGTFRGRDFEVELDIGSIPPSAQRVVLGGDACPADDDMCNSLSAPLRMD
jgi:hypothetical protein